MIRKKCLNCNNKIDNDGEAFCKECNDNYFICNDCNNIYNIDKLGDNEFYVCKECMIFNKILDNINNKKELNNG